MKRKLKKFLTAIIVLILITSFILPSATNYGQVFAATQAETVILDMITNALGLFVGLHTWGLRLAAFGLGAGISVIINSLAALGNNFQAQDAEAMNSSITPVTIFFNKIAILDVNFFDLNPENAGSDSIIIKFRTTIATWYYVMRLLATAILLVILIYVGIRMALSTVASDKAMYKKMLVDWTASLALIYLLHYFIEFILNINEALVKAIESTGTQLFVNNGINDFQDILMTNSLSPTNGFVGIICTVLYVFIIWQTVKFTFVYFKRMLTVGFLIVIAPLITITYSLDKMGDGKAQALGTWLKEFCYNILIQPFHCILYLAFVNIAMTLLQDGISNVGGAAGGDKVKEIFQFFFPSNAAQTVGAGILAIICLNFIDKAEDIIRNIFGFSKASSLTSAVAAAGVVTTLASNASKLGTSGAKMVAGARVANRNLKNTFKGIGNRVDKATNTMRQNRVDRKANRAIDSGKVIVDSNADRAAQLAQARAQLGYNADGHKESFIRKKVSAADTLAKRAANSTKKMRQKTVQRIKEREERNSSRRIENIIDDQFDSIAREQGSTDGIVMFNGQRLDRAQFHDNQMVRDRAAEKELETRASTMIKGAVGSTKNFASNAVKFAKDNELTPAAIMKNNIAGAAAIYGGVGNMVGSGQFITSVIAAAGIHDGISTYMEKSKGTLMKGIDKELSEVENISGQQFNHDGATAFAQTAVAMKQNGMLSGDNLQKQLDKVVKRVEDIAAKVESNHGGSINLNASDIANMLSNVQVSVSNGVDFNSAVNTAINNSKFGDSTINNDQRDQIKGGIRDYMLMNKQASIAGTTSAAMTMGFVAGDMISKRRQSYQAPKGSNVDQSDVDRIARELEKTADSYIAEIEKHVLEAQAIIDAGAKYKETEYYKGLSDFDKAAVDVVVDTRMEELKQAVNKHRENPEHPVNNTSNEPTIGTNS